MVSGCTNLQPSAVYCSFFFLFFFFLITFYTYQLSCTSWNTLNKHEYDILSGQDRVKLHAALLLHISRLLIVSLVVDWLDRSLSKFSNHSSPSPDKRRNKQIFTLKKKTCIQRSN
jgi:hypothetical protein